MKSQICRPPIVLTALIALWCVSVPFPASAEELYYHFDFDDGVMPEVLDAVTFPLYDEVTETLSWEVSDGQLHVYDTVPVSCGVYFLTQDDFADASVSVTLDDFQGNFYLSARDNGELSNYDNYGCWLWRSPHTDEMRLFLEKIVDGETVFRTQTDLISAPGPYGLQLDVLDCITTSDVEYTKVTAELTFNGGQDSRTLNTWDYGTLGGHDRLLSGYATFGVMLGSTQRDEGWTLDALVDDVTIRGTLVPEPGVLVLAVFGAALLTWRRSRR